MGFLLASLGLLNLFLTIAIFSKVNTHTDTREHPRTQPGTRKAAHTLSARVKSSVPTRVCVCVCTLTQFFGDDWKGLFEAITGYGLGGSSIALFGRVGGGIYTKVGADIVMQGTQPCRGGVSLVPSLVPLVSFAMVLVVLTKPRRRRVQS